MRLPVKFVALAALFVLGLGACDDSEDTQALIDEYCELSKTLDEQDGPPTVEQIDEIAEAAPPDIEEPAQTFQEAFEAADGNIGKAFSDEDAEAAIEEIEAWEKDNCPHAKDRPDDEDEGDDGEDVPEGEPAPAEGANVIEVTGTEYAYEGIPATVPAGPTAFGFTNEGEEEHEFQLFKVKKGTVQEALAFEGDPEDAGLVKHVGGAFGSPGDEATYVNLDLEAGTYGVVCFVPSEEGKPHAELGMVVEFTVEAA